MLVLTRGLNESIVIGGIATVKVMQISGGHVRLGVDAPRNVAVNRQEIEIAKRQREGGDDV